MKQRILGIDPGYGRVGFACLEQIEKNVSLADCGLITTDANISFSDRLLQIYEDIQTIIESFQPTIAVVESLYFSKNVTTALQVAESRGVLTLACAKHGISVVSINPTQLKSIITGYGKADKTHVSEMIRRELSLGNTTMIDDTVDAIAIAYAGSLLSLNV